MTTARPSRFLIYGRDFLRTVATVESYCLQNNLQFTDIRRKILSVLMKSEVALGADAIAKLTHFSKPPSTVQVYRTLEFLQSAGVINHIVSKKAYTIRETPDNPDEKTVLFVCEDCGLVHEAAVTKVKDAVSEIARIMIFEVGKLPLEVMGLCRTCGPKAKQVGHAENKSTPTPRRWGK